jgi:hypothetical protein
MHSLVKGESSSDTDERDIVPIPTNRMQEYLWLGLLVLVLTPAMYLLFRHSIVGYGVIWLTMLSIGPLSAKYPRVNLVQASLFISLVASLLIAMVPR